MHDGGPSAGSPSRGTPGGGATRSVASPHALQASRSPARPRRDLPRRRARRAAEDEPTHEHRVDALVEHAGIRADGPGVGVLVVTPQGVLIKKGYGLANLEKHEPVTAATTFELASVSKQMCGAAVLL